ncbi:hypothetical protein FA95DRAFT_1574427 [Auriscalpium vulgare]|uniref:Uncharacterized protein n=1 Tax=Auriscalpium vulgare TaxID=40419 RepID=A0ACB8RKL7_9AGAM|nr:hypothetical protein FA95DRAFT_1574427 [Auriscalpium vulgare]
MRSQLAVDEAERRDFKIKWERIVHRKFGRTVTAPPSAVSASAPAQSTHSRSVDAVASPLAMACCRGKSTAVTQVSHPPALLKALHLTNLTEIKAPESASGFAADLESGRSRALKTMTTFA